METPTVEYKMRMKTWTEYQRDDPSRSLGVELGKNGRGPIAFAGAVEHVLRWSSKSISEAVDELSAV